MSQIGANCHRNLGIIAHFHEQDIVE
jgi:hypothetical protein